MEKSVYFVSLGCPKNFVDTEVLAGSLLSSGWNLVFEPADADLYVINSCAFIPSARAEAEKAVKEAVRWKKKYGGRLAVAGCLSKYDLENGVYRKKFPEVDIWSGPDDVGSFARIVNEAAKPEISRPGAHYLYDHRTPRLQLTLPHVAYLKIADGCDNRCAYCAIPDIRGTLRSRPAESVVAEAQNLVAAGVKELIIIAQDLTAYGHDRSGKSELAALLRQIEELEGDFVMRLLYTHPAHYTDEFISCMAESRKILPYLDIPLQHISDALLLKMGRKADGKSIRALLAKLRRSIKDLTLRTTFIAGLPGETEEDFLELCAFLKEERFERAGVFAYSPEQNTPAAGFAGQVDAETAKKRVRKLMKIQREVMASRQAEQIGRVERVLIDTVESRTLAVGRGRMDAPDIDNQIVVKSRRKLTAGGFYDVKIIDADQFQLWGETV